MTLLKKRHTWNTHLNAAMLWTDLNRLSVWTSLKKFKQWTPISVLFSLTRWPPWKTAIPCLCTSGASPDASTKARLGPRRFVRMVEQCWASEQTIEETDYEDYGTDSGKLRSRPRPCTYALFTIRKVCGLLASRFIGCSILMVLQETGRCTVGGHVGNLHTVLLNSKWVWPGKVVQKRSWSLNAFAPHKEDHENYACAPATLTLQRKFDMARTFPQHKVLMSHCPCPLGIAVVDLKHHGAKKPHGLTHMDPHGA